MRLSYKIGFGMIVLFLIWFFYALFTYEELEILMPLMVGLAITPIFIWYFLLIYLYEKLPRYRIPIFVLFIPSLLWYVYYLERL